MVVLLWWVYGRIIADCRGWMIRVCRVEKGEEGREGKKGSHMPVFVFILTKFKKMANISSVSVTCNKQNL